jgi:hypothetical protein
MEKRLQESLQEEQLTRGFILHVLERLRLNES